MNLDAETARHHLLMACSLIDSQASAPGVILVVASRFPQI